MPSEIFAEFLYTWFNFCLKVVKWSDIEAQPSGSVGLSVIHTPKGHRFDPQSGIFLGCRFNPNQGTYLSFRVDPQSGHIREATNQSMFSFPLPSSLSKINFLKKHILRWGFRKKDLILNISKEVFNMYF